MYFSILRVRYKSSWKERDVEKYSMCAHTGAPKWFFVIFAKRIVWILIYVDVITFQINLLYFLI